jgi:hypothetical protein
MQTEHPEGLVRKLNWRFYVFVPLAAFLAPLLADSLHSYFVVRRGIRFYQAELGYIDYLGFWVWVALRGIVDFFVMWFIIWLRIRDIWIWCCLVGLWTWLAFKMEVVIK